MNRNELVVRLRTVFETRGFEGATLNEIARASGLSKASLYHHFPDGKAGMGLALLRDAGDRLEAAVLAPLRRDDIGAGARLDAMLAGVDDYFEGGTRSCLLTVFALGPPDERFGELIEARLREWIELLAGTLQCSGLGRKEARRRARDTVARIQGAAVLARALREPKPFRQVLRRIGADLGVAA